jgi:DNA repair exonuclease SbcCD nuclease subunit
MKDFYYRLFDDMKNRGVDHILHLGDFFYSRKSLSIETIAFTNWFMDTLAFRGIHMTILVGNHDTPSNSDLETNSIWQLMQHSDNISVVSEPSSIAGIDIIPWICRSNEDEIEHYIMHSTSKYCIGHFDIIGAKFSKRGMVSKHGLDVDYFKHYKMVLSGHYHTKSKIGNVEYLGSPFQFDWNDWNDTKYYHYFDWNTGQLEAVESGVLLFVQAIVDEFGTQFIPAVKSISGMVVRAEIRLSETDEIETATKALQEMNPYQLDITIVGNKNTYVENISEESINEITTGGLDKIFTEYISKQEWDDNMKQSVIEYLGGKL